jgi:hypothetical protein
MNLHLGPCSFLACHSRKAIDAQMPGYATGGARQDVSRAAWKSSLRYTGVGAFVLTSDNVSFESRTVVTAWQWVRSALDSERSVRDHE